MFTLSVRQVEFLTPDIFELELERGDYAFEAGECAVLFNGEGDSRPYSFSSSPNDEFLRFLIRRIPDGAVSSWLAARAPGDPVTVSSPFGEFRPAQAPDEKAVFVATGVGISPFLSTLRDRHPAVRPLCFYGVRVADDAVHTALLGAHTDLRLAVSREAVDGIHYGHVTELVANMPIREATSYYLCGHDAMVSAVWDQLLARGVDREQIHAEVFFGIS
jgi:ferredoxin-NADP reductase